MVTLSPFNDGLVASGWISATIINTLQGTITYPTLGIGYASFQEGNHTTLINTLPPIIKVQWKMAMIER